MATYVVGDVHGCFDTLRALLRRLPFDPATDRLWLAGDLANRGPGALETLRWAREMAHRLGPRFAAVLGNHDLHLLRRAAGLRPANPRDTLDVILEADDGDELVAWIAGLPLLQRGAVEVAPPGGDADTDPEGGVAETRQEWVLVHAGLWPGWNPAMAEREARRAERWLRDPGRRPRVLDLESAQSGPVGAGRPGGGEATARGGEEDAPAADSDLSAARRALYAFTELRTLRRNGEACAEFSGPPAEAPAGCLPWYRHPSRPPRWRTVHVAFGHWAALGLHRGEGVLGLDSGVIWGGPLTAVRLEDGAVFQQSNREPAAALPQSFR